MDKKQLKAAAQALAAKVYQLETLLAEATREYAKAHDERELYKQAVEVISGQRNTLADALRDIARETGTPYGRTAQETLAACGLPLEASGPDDTMDDTPNDEEN